MTDVRTVGVVGCGLMGTGIAELRARKSLGTLVYEVDARAVEAGRGRIASSLARAVERGKLAGADRDATLKQVAFTTDLADFADRDLAIEAVPEDGELKLRVFAGLGQAMIRADALLASNTSSIPIMKLAAATSRPGQVVGLHFFNPVPVLDLVELIPSLVTADAAHDIDEGMVRGCAHPMGPLRLADHIGLDTTLAVAESLYAEFREPRLVPPALLQRMVQAGHLGRKTGIGFYK
ncbi:3-hydroxyacyl-CoA dehydrogenase NAD-binding domain-containing protein [Streptomyces phaeochromogenes]|uniref:3-hydroxyacyl-CoA dehydrogenase NAD-binding domain-containing protein n=1 Tax=Streptomyces phaeochromogenes TaxID=1923 RepID=UPI0033C2B23F